MILLLDNFDSFTYNLVDYFSQLNISCTVVRSDASLDYIKSIQPSAIILSPGPEIPAKSGCLMSVINFYHNKVPIVGICLGHQAIGEFFGMQLIKAPKPRHGKITKILVEKHSLFDGIPRELQVVQYNSLILEQKTETDLEVIAKSQNGQIMAITHRSLPIWGIQFHPEAALTEYGLQMLKNWIDCNNISF